MEKEEIMGVTTIKRGSFSACASSFGAELRSLIHNEIEYLWQGDPQWWDRRAPVLFPIVGVLRNNEAETESGPIHLSIHGFAWTMEHKLIDVQPESMTFELRNDKETYEAYPFAFTLRTSYTLISDDTIEQRFIVVNDGEHPMPFIIGGHPGINVPINPASDEVFDDYALVFTKPWTATSPSLTPEHLVDWEHPFEVVTDSDRLHLTHRTYDIDTITLEHVPDSTVTLLGQKSGHGVEMKFADFPYFGSWSAINDGPYVCLEPWTGMSTATDEGSDFAKQRGVITLAPHKQWEGAFTMRLF